jgi:hypothetical protein
MLFLDLCIYVVFADLSNENALVSTAWKPANATPSAGRNAHSTPTRARTNFSLSLLECGDVEKFSRYHRVMRLNATKATPEILKRIGRRFLSRR